MRVGEEGTIVLEAERGDGSRQSSSRGVAAGNVWWLTTPSGLERALGPDKVARSQSLLQRRVLPFRLPCTGGSLAFLPPLSLPCSLHNNDSARAGHPGKKPLRLL